MVEIVKNRQRSKYTFANINLLGKCNLDCYYCLGKDLEAEFGCYNQLKTHFHKWDNFEEFLTIAKKEGIEKIYVTGQNTDSLLYNYLDKLMGYLKSKGFGVGLRTNGIAAKTNIGTINKCYKCSVGYTVLTLSRDVMQNITGVRKIPDWEWIFKNTKVPMRVSIVVNRYNLYEFYEILRFLSRFKNIKYVQARRIATDTRFSLLKEDVQLFENLHGNVERNFRKVKSYETADTFDINGLEVNFWRTVSTTANSMNYFTNGVISKDYFIIEGYLKNYMKYIGGKID